MLSAHFKQPSAAAADIWRLHRPGTRPAPAGTGGVRAPGLQPVWEGGSQAPWKAQAEQRAGACECPLFSQAQILSCCTPKPFPAPLCPQPALPSAERLQGFPVSPEPETKHSALAATGRILPRNHNFSSASPAVCLPVLPHFPLGRAAGSCQHSWFMGTAATGTAQSSSNPLARECVLRLSVTAKSHSLAFPSGLENPVTDLITQGMPQNSCSLPCREATGRAGAGVYCYNILKHSAPKDNTDKRRQLDNNHDFEQSKHGING